MFEVLISFLWSCGRRPLDHDAQEENRAAILRKDHKLEDLPTTLEKAEGILKKIDPGRAASELSIVEWCVRNFAEVIMPDVSEGETSASFEARSAPPSYSPAGAVG